MDYFELYGLPVTFNPDPKLVKKKFYELSKKYHPDFYINEEEEKQEEVLQLSTLNNKAFQVFRDAQRRIQYVLTLKGLLTEGDHYALPQHFLMEMMDVNEALMELQFEPDPVKLASITAEIDSIEKGILDELSALTTAYDTQPASEQESTLKAIKDLYYRNKYLYRIRESLAKIK
jgi:molecular chaperone HscB